MYAVIETGGKQYRVQTGDEFCVERLTGEVGDEVVLDRVLMLGDENGAKFGTPFVDGANVKVEILAQDRDKKILVFKYKSKKNYRRLRGHRQYFTKVRVREIGA